MKNINLLNFIFLILLIINACSLEMKTDTKPDAYDGIYNISCISEDIYKAVGDIEVKSSKISGKIVNTKNNEFTVSGSVDGQGIILFNTLWNNQGKIAAVGKIDKEGIVEGIYSVDTRKGKYFGFRYQKDEIDTKKDGNYKIEFKRKNLIVANTTISINKGKFNSVIESASNIKYPIKGHVLEGGKIIINTVIGSQAKGIAASGIIKKESLRGVYFLHTGEKGTFTGKRI